VSGSVSWKAGAVRSAELMGSLTSLACTEREGKKEE
jgi:hypothetical protein